MARLEKPFGRWYRHSKYVVDDGYVRPAKGARLRRYSPWDQYLEASRTRRTGQTPYQSLVRLVRNRNFDTKGDLDALLDWCEQYGLLGLLPHRALLIAHAPRWQHEQDFVNYEVEDGALWPVMWIDARVSEGWVRTREPWRREAAPKMEGEPGLWLAKGLPRVLDQAQHNQLVPRETVPDWPVPFVVMQALKTSAVDAEPLGKTFARYFPDVRPDEHETFPYPQPGSPAFWRTYAEPVSDVLEAARFLLRIVETLSALSRGPGSSKQSPRRVTTSLRDLSLLVSSVRSVLRPDDRGQLTEQRVAPSLLGWLALMLLQDFDDGQVMGTCRAHGCGAGFTSSRENAEYCSPKCRMREKQRRHRQRKTESGNTPSRRRAG